MWMCGDVIIHSGLIYMKIYPNQPRVWRMCVPKAGALGLKIMTAHEYLPLTNSHVPPPRMCCHWTIDHLLLFFLQAHMSWWWVSSRPSPRSQSSVPWRWQTSPSSPRFTDGCGSWRWRSCSGCWPECRELPVETLHPPGSRTTRSCHACPAGFALFQLILDKWEKTMSQDWAAAAAAQSPRVSGLWPGGVMQEWQRLWHEETVFTLWCVTLE